MGHYFNHYPSPIPFIFTIFLMNFLKKHFFYAQSNVWVFYYEHDAQYKNKMIDVE